MPEGGAEVGIDSRFGCDEIDRVAFPSAEAFGVFKDHGFRFVIEWQEVRFIGGGFAGEGSDVGAGFHNNQVVAHRLERDFADIFQGQRHFVARGDFERFRIVGHLIVAGDLDFENLLRGQIGGESEEGGDGQGFHLRKI